MVQTIAPRDSGGLTGADSERRREEPVRPEPGPADIKFDLGSMGAMPAGIPVEPTTLQFEATEGFGDIFGAMPTAAADLELEQTPFTETADRSRTAFVENQPASPPSLPEVNDITRTIRLDDAGLANPGNAFGEGLQSEFAPPPARIPASFATGPSTNGQNAASEVPEKPVLRRAGVPRADSGLPDFGQAIQSGAGVVGSGVTDTSFSDLAEATGLRRNTGPVDPGTPGVHSTGPLHHQESPESYPVLINGDKPSLWSRLRWPVVAMLLLGMLATVGYFLGFQKWLGGGKLEPRQSANVRPVAGTSGAAITPVQANESAKPADSTSKPTESPATVETPTAIKEPEPSQAAAAAPPPAVDGAQPTHSLQAASFPNEAGAKEFAEKLVRAGVPSYIVSVDIPRRGKWFRVRVGQFPNAAEATKYSAQARQRARAAGINLDLMVCDYEKP